MNGGSSPVRGRPSVSPVTKGMPDLVSGAATVHQQRWPLVSALEFGALATAVPCARLHTNTVLHEWEIGELADDAGLIVSELVTNALKASQALQEIRPFALSLRSDYTRLIIEVWDHSPREPRSALAGGDAEGGRGLLVVRAARATPLQAARTARCQSAGAWSVGADQPASDCRWASTPAP